MYARVYVVDCSFVCVFPESCSKHNFVMQGGISKLFGRDDHYDNTLQETCHQLKCYGNMALHVHVTLELCAHVIVAHARDDDL